MDYATASELARLFGLGLFFTIFVAIVVWTFRPGARSTFDNHARIPLEEREEFEQ